MVKVVFSYFCEVLVYPKRIYYFDYILLYFVTYAALAQIFFIAKNDTFYGVKLVILKLFVCKNMTFRKSALHTKQWILYTTQCIPQCTLHTSH